MVKSELNEALSCFTEGTGFGTPEARRNAEIHLQIVLAKEQGKTASRLNLITFGLFVVGALQVVILILK